MGRGSILERLQLFGAVGGAVFAIRQAALVDFAVVLFTRFAQTFAAQMSTAVALVGCRRHVRPLPRRDRLLRSSPRPTAVRAPSTVPSESYGDAHFLYAAGVGGTHLANFAAAAFVGATAAATLTSAAPGRRLGWIGIGLSGCLPRFLAWVFAASVLPVVAMRRHANPAGDAP